MQPTCVVHLIENIFLDVEVFPTLIVCLSTALKGANDPITANPLYAPDDILLVHFENDKKRDTLQPGITHFWFLEHSPFEYLAEGSRMTYPC